MHLHNVTQIVCAKRVILFDVITLWLRFGYLTARFHRAKLYQTPSSDPHSAYRRYRLFQICGPDECFWCGPNLGFNNLLSGNARGSASHSKGIFSTHTRFLFNGSKQKLSQVAQSRESHAGNRTQERAFGQFSK